VGVSVLVVASTALLLFLLHEAGHWSPRGVVQLDRGPPAALERLRPRCSTVAPKRVGGRGTGRYCCGFGIVEVEVDPLVGGAAPPTPWRDSNSSPNAVGFVVEAHVGMGGWLLLWFGCIVMVVVDSSVRVSIM
jgi:hypothetical protein